jgi:hypothetical protein
MSGAVQNSPTEIRMDVDRGGQEVVTEADGAVEQKHWPMATERACIMEHLPISTVRNKDFHEIISNFYH